MRKLFSGIILLLLIGCTFPGFNASINTPMPATATGSPLPPAISYTASRPSPTPASLGTQENPLVLALFPSSAADGTRIEAGKAFAGQLADDTGYTFVVVAPESYSNLVEALGRGNAHIAVLSPYAYALAYKKGYVTAAFASLREGQKTYGAQFIARVDSGFTSYFDPRTQENTADAATALTQFRDKKPCWADATSPSGYIIPSGILAYNEISTRPAAFVQGQPTVARAVYVGGICDFGATYIDARGFPALQEDFPDIMEQVSVLWRIPQVIPYENISLAESLSPEVKAVLKAAIFRASGTQAGRQSLGRAYGIETWEPVDDAFYAEYLLYVDASGVNPADLTNE